MNKPIKLLCLGLLLSMSVSACDSPFSLQTQITQAKQPISLRANISSSQPGNPQASLLVHIPNPELIPEEFRQSDDLKVIVDSSKSQVNVTREADGSLKFLISPALQKDSTGALNVLLNHQGKTQSITLLTGPTTQLKKESVLVSPSAQVTQGTRIQLKANLTDEKAAENLSFTWSVSTSLTGQWTPLSGNQSQVEWQDGAFGNYYVRILMTDKNTQTRFSYTSPNPVFRISDSDKIARVTSGSDSIFQGESIGIQANLSEFKDQSAQYQWSYGQSLQGSFQPISETGEQITWEPSLAGSYYLRIQVTSADNSLSTYTSSKPIVFVSTSDNLFQVNPSSGLLSRGERIKLKAQVPQSTPDLTYAWSYGFSPQGSFTPISGDGQEIEWNPDLTGDFFLRVKTFDSKTELSQTFTSAKSLVTVQDDDRVFEVFPQPAQIFKGSNLVLRLKNTESQTISWAYSTSQRGPFTLISGNGQGLVWTPVSAGSFYLQAKVTEKDGSVSSFTSANTLVSVSEHPNPIVTEQNSSVSLQLGQGIKVKSNLDAELLKGAQFQWGYSTSQQGPFSPMLTLESVTQPAVTWYPPIVGSFYVQAQMTAPGSQTPLTFVSTDPLVIVSENVPFFSTSPSPGKVKKDVNITLKTKFDNRGRSFNYGWAYSKSSAGPFTPLGGSTQPEFVWENNSKPLGSYYIRFTATAPGSARQLSFVSRTPLVFITNTDQSGSQFGSNEGAATPPAGF